MELELLQEKQKRGLSKRPTILEGALLSLIAAISGSVLFSALNLVLPGDTLLRLLVSLLSLAYIGYLMTRSRERLGRITAFGSWILVTLTGLLLAPSLLLSVLLHCGFHLDRPLCLSAQRCAGGCCRSGADRSEPGCSRFGQQCRAEVCSHYLVLFSDAGTVCRHTENRSKNDFSPESGDAGFYQAWQSAQKALSKMVSL